jgi:peroxiredoxin Q/BCP
LASLAGALASGALYACASKPVVRPDGGQGLLPLGAPAPNVSGRDLRGRTLRLDEARGHAAVVYFYPKNETPGCTKEACAFRDRFDQFETRGVRVFAISQDSEASHQQFRTKYKLPFALVSDPDGVAAKAYGVGTMLGLTARVTFIVDPAGRIAHVFPDVDPALHADEVLAEVSKLEAQAEHR